MFAEIETMCLNGLKGEFVYTETDIGRGIPDLQIVGLGDTSVHEAGKRVRASIINSGIKFPVGKITVNLAPADMKKEGSGFDLPIALGILASSGILPVKNVKGIVAIGELSLDGKIRRVDGVLPMLAAGRSRDRIFIIPMENKGEAEILQDANIIAADTLGEVIELLKYGTLKKGMETNANTGNETDYVDEIPDFETDMCHIRGQKRAKRTAEIASSGGHNVLIKGSPGCGKTMLAKAIAGILPPMTYREMVEVTSVYSAAGLLENGDGYIRKRPFRQAHAGITATALIGGGKSGKTGEITLAHNGVLFLDEFAEMRRSTCEALRQPLEDKIIQLSKQGNTFTFPADFMLVAAANPCKCGYLYEEGRCKCTPTQVKMYERSISGPLADRIDMHIEMISVPYSEIESSCDETSGEIRQRVIKARKIQSERFYGENIKTNAAIPGNLIDRYCETDFKCKSFLSAIMNKEGFSMRSYGKILKIARTIADMEGREKIIREDIAEAAGYRPKFAKEKV